MIFVFIYIAAITIANLTIAAFGPWFSPINAFILIGLDMVLRDHLHDKWRGQGLGLKMLGMILSAGVVSYVLNPATQAIAIASMVAFTAAGAVNAVVYHFAKTWHWLKRSNSSNAVAAMVDSLIFPTLAFGLWMPEIFAAQFMAKFGGGFLWSLIFWKTLKANNNGR